MDEPYDIRRLELARTWADAGAVLRVDWARELNDQQLAAVSAPDGPVLVLAGAGSGKTRVITYRVAFLISQRRVSPRNILLATFTNKAARSMLARAQAVAGEAARDVAGGTFHHIANLQLRRFARLLGYDSNFTILDEADAQAVMKLCRIEAGVDTTARAFPSARLLCSVASAMININTDLDSLLLARYAHLFDYRGDIERVLLAYHERKRQCNQMDFDDLLINLHLLLTTQVEARQALCRRFHHVLVDEYQDVNHLQAAIVRELYLGGTETMGAETVRGEGADDVPPPLGLEDVSGAGAGEHEAAAAYPAGRSLFVVGDDAQSIYSFRGADYTNIRSFPHVFPAARVYKLETNYRSVPQVLELANAVIEDADPLFRKELRPVKPPAADRPLLLACQDSDEQAEFAAEQVLKLREEHGIDFSRMAVLYRAHANRLEIELAFTQRGIPFVVRGGLRFFEQAHVKDLLSYLLVLANSRDELAWQRLLGMCHRVGPKTIASVLAKLRGAPEADGGPLQRFTNNGALVDIRGQAKESLSALRDFLRTLSDETESLPPPDVLQRVLDDRYRAYMELQYENWRAREDDLEQLIVFSARFGSLRAFLAEVGLNGSFTGSEITAEYDGVDREEGAVTLSTIHQAKGLEWQVVFLVHCEDEMLPHRMSQGDPASEDEERRLLYVAVTRAEELLFMSYPQFTQTRDFQRLIHRPSRFLASLPPGRYDEAVLEWTG
jgi:DNA helicase-2/ATP-dependent DNA helicase PcrA